MATTTLSNEEILEAIGNKSVLELADLIDAFKTKFNVTVAAAPVGSGAGGGAAPPAVEGQSGCGGSALGPFVLRGSELLMPQTTRSVITFSKREGGMPMPHLLDIQTAAFQTLLVPDDVHGARQDVSLERVFRDLFPITDVNEK